jgi:hypothetical protein
MEKSQKAGGFSKSVEPGISDSFTFECYLQKATAWRVRL